jgi:hypothetical protein
MTTHANAAMAGIGPLRAERKCGITAPGQVSELGRASTVARSLQVGDDVVTSAPLQVFEVPQTPVMNGMLGIGWLRGRRAMADYVNGRIALPGSDEDTKHEHGRLRSEGYTAHRMNWDEACGAFTVEV